MMDHAPYSVSALTLIACSRPLALLEGKKRDRVHQVNVETLDATGLKTRLGRIGGEYYDDKHPIQAKLRSDGQKSDCPARRVHEPVYNHGQRLVTGATRQTSETGETLSRPCALWSNNREPGAIPPGAGISGERASA